MKQTLSPQAPARVRRGQLRALALGLSASTLAMACSFGEIQGDDGDLTNVVPGNDSAAPAPGASDDSPAVTPVGSVTAPPAPNDSAADDDDATYVGEDPFSSELGKQVKLILEVNCAGCHQGTKSGDMDYVLELDELVKNGKVLPGNKEDSDLFVRMQQQSMPPAFMRTQRPTYSQIDQVGLFIDELDTSFGGPPRACNSLDFL
ncbi:MAG: hypothetical protein RL685_7170, partial [Pseudomonadota bacterium]